MSTLFETVLKNRKVSPAKLKKLSQLTEKMKHKWALSVMGAKERSLTMPKLIDMDKIARPRIKELSKIVRNNHKPYSSANVFIGIEIECFLKRDDFDGDTDCTCECDCSPNECDSCGHEHDEVDCTGDCRANCECTNEIFSAVERSLKRAGIKSVTVVNDGSLSHDDDDYTGVEIRLLTTEGHYASTVEKTCAWLAKHGAKVNTTCGLHVHLDYRSAEKIEVLEAANKFDSAMSQLIKMMPDSRRRNSYCLPGISEDDRYRRVNVSSWEKHGSLEIRVHSGTTNAEKISNWIAILLAIKAKGTEPFIEKRTVHTLMNFLEVSDSVKKYAVERAAMFSGEAVVEDAATFEDGEAA